MPIVRIQNLNDPTKPFNYTSKMIPEKFRVRPGDTLLSWSGTPGTSFGCFRWSGPEGWLNQHIFNVHLSDEVLPSFFIYQVNSKLDELIGKAHGGVGLQHITKGALSSVNVTVPPLSIQERIVKLLDEAGALRKLRTEADGRAANLIPALFHEMFGDPITNPRRWPRINLGDVVFAAQDGPHVSPKYSVDGVPFLSTRHIRPGRVDWDDLKFLSFQEAELQWRKCKPEKGDVLYTKGGTTGIAAAVTFDTPIAVWVHVAVLKTNHEKVDPLWLENMLNSSFCYQQARELTHGIANRDLGLTRMVKIGMYLPPLEMQKDFGSRVALIREMETNQVASRSRFDDLFQSMLHRAFNGEL